MMIGRRLLALFIDFIFGLLPTLALYFGARSIISPISLTFLIPIIFFLGIVVEVIYSKGCTAGTSIAGITAYDKTGTKTSPVKVLLYYLLLSISLFPALNHLPSLLLFFFIIVPLPFLPDRSSGFDLLFKIRWDVRKAGTS